MKKILAVAIILVMLVAMVACEASKGDLTSINDYVAPNYTYVTETGTFTFAEAGGNTAVITGYVGKAEPHAVVIPAEVTVASLDENVKDEDNVRKIVGIADQALYYCTAMTSVTIPASVKSIGNEAFYGCSKLTSVTFANPNGWWYTSSDTATSGTALLAADLSNASTAATYLKSTYYNYYWKRT